MIDASVPQTIPKTNEGIAIKMTAPWRNMLPVKRRILLQAEI